MRRGRGQDGRKTVKKKKCEVEMLNKTTAAGFTNLTKFKGKVTSATAEFVLHDDRIESFYTFMNCFCSHGD